MTFSGCVYVYLRSIFNLSETIEARGLRWRLAVEPRRNKRGRWTSTPATSVSTIRTVTPGVLVFYCICGIGD